jgi:hypothetical protein
VQFGKHLPVAGVIEQRLIVPDEEVIEAKLDVGVEDVDAKNVGRDFVNGGHGFSPSLVRSQEVWCDQEKHQEGNRSIGPSIACGCDSLDNTGNVSTKL